MIKSYGIVGQSQETRTDLNLGAPYILMQADRPEPNYVATESGEWIEPPVSAEEILSWWDYFRPQRDRVLPPVVDLGLTAKAFAATENDPDKKAELEALVIECIGADGFGGLAQELRDLPNDPAFKAAVESQPDFDGAKAYVLSWYQAKALAASPQLRARLKGAV